MRKKKKPPEEVTMKTMTKAHQWAESHRHSKAFDQWLAEADRREAEICKVMSIWQKAWIWFRSEIRHDLGF